MSRYDDILARLRAATGPDREIDAEIDCLIRYPALRPAKNGDHGGKYDPISTGNIWCPTGFLLANSNTRSIDDALAVVEQKLPGWTHQLFTDPLLAPSGARCRLGSVERTRRGRGWPKHNFEAHAATEPLAILIALFEALKAKEE